MVRSEGDMSLKNPVTTPGIDPGTVRLNLYATPGHTVAVILKQTYEALKNLVTAKRHNIY
jgi:hypothetical protein